MELFFDGQEKILNLYYDYSALMREANTRLVQEKGIKY